MSNESELANEQRVRAAVPEGQAIETYSGKKLFISAPLVVGTQVVLMGIGDEWHQMWDSAVTHPSVVAFEQQHRPSAPQDEYLRITEQQREAGEKPKRSLAEVLEELCPGVGQRNGAPTCVNCKLPWSECHCADYVQPKMTTDEDDIPEAQPVAPDSGKGYMEIERLKGELAEFDRKGRDLCSAYGNSLIRIGDLERDQLMKVREMGILPTPQGWVNARAVAAEAALATSHASGKQEGRKEALEAVRGKRLAEHDACLIPHLPDSIGDTANIAYSNSIDDAEQAILALPEAT